MDVDAAREEVVKALVSREAREDGQAGDTKRSIDAQCHRPRTELAATAERLTAWPKRPKRSGAAASPDGPPPEALVARQY